MLDLNRLPNETTAVFLGRVLDELELNDMANRARAFHYDDYFCPPDIDDGMNINRLVIELRDHINSSSLERAGDIRFVIEAAMDGVFDGTKEESAAWAASPSGQDAFRRLVEGR